MTPNQTLREIEELTDILIRLSLSDKQNYPSTHGLVNGLFEITVQTAGQMSAALKNVPYRDIYNELDSLNCFNIKMLDGGLLTFRYRFNRGNVTEHVLCYYPSPDLELFQNDPELYLIDEVFADVVAKSIVAFPVRFDYSDDTAKFVEVHHPYSHMSLGQYKNCRIPVCSPVSPIIFTGFVLRNFYNTAFKKYSDDLPSSTNHFAKTITPAERKIPHVVCC